MEKDNNHNSNSINDEEMNDLLKALNNWAFQPGTKSGQKTEQKETKQSYVRITKDDMEAYLYLAPPEKGESYDEMTVVSLLKNKGVVSGILDSNIRGMLHKKVYARETLVAKGQKAVSGKNGYYQFFFSMDKKPIPKIRKDGSVDYRDFQVLQNVKKDDMLALYHPAEKGKPGYNVKGVFFPLKKGEEQPPLKGKGFYRNEGSNAYFAAVDGKVEYKNYYLEIRTVHIIEKDVNALDGKIEFFGDIWIKGNVESGTHIRTAKTLTIEGSVGACRIYAGGNIVLKKGIQGGDKAVVSTHGSLYANFIEHTTVDAWEDVTAVTILNSNIHAGGKVFLKDKKSAIIGGFVHGTQGIETQSAGNDSEVRTILHAGNSLEILQEKRENFLLKKCIYEKRAEVEKKIAAIKQLQNRNPGKTVMKTEMQAMQRSLTELTGKMKEVQEKEKQIQEVMEKAVRACIKIDGPVYYGVVVSIDENRYEIPADTSFMKYENIDGKLTGKIIIR